MPVVLITGSTGLIGSEAANDIPVSKLMQWSGLEKEPEKRRKLFAELESLQKTGKFKCFVNAVEILTSL